MAGRGLDVAILGATGAMGRGILQALEEGDLPLGSLRLLASGRADRAELEFQGEPVPTEAVKDGSFRGCVAAVFAAGDEAARTWAPRARAEGCAVVDLSAAFGLELDVPLVVPDVNLDAARAAPRGIVACGRGASASLAAVLRPVRDAAGLERLVVATCEPVSGAGQGGLEQLERQARDLLNGREPEPGGALPYRIAFNLVPQVGAFGPDGRTEEESRLAEELRKILAEPGLRVSATAVRVPVFYGSAAAVNLTTRRKLTAAEARELFRKAPGVKLLDDPAGKVYPMPILAVNDESTLVGRVREDASEKSGLDLFLAADPLRQGAASAVRILRLLAERRP
jgi:aspartate-semialdehyde dehydrogenase